MFRLAGRLVCFLALLVLCSPSPFGAFPAMEQENPAPTPSSTQSTDSGKSDSGKQLKKRGDPPDAAAPKPPSDPNAKPIEPPEENPPEEDEGQKEKVYVFNPLQATKEIEAGDFYLHKGNPRAAANRYLEASKWNPGSCEALLKLGDLQEKQHDKPAARSSYKKCADSNPGSKEAAEAQKHLAKLK